MLPSVSTAGDFQRTNQREIILEKNLSSYFLIGMKEKKIGRLLYGLVCG